MGKQLKSLAKKLLDEEQSSEGSGRPLDEEYDPLNPTLRGGPRSVFRSPGGMIVDQETRAIDELLAGIPKAQGFYLKLSKEIRPGEFEYKIRIDNWEGWDDLQEAVAKIVRGYTEKNKFNGRWGSGTYQILVSKAGGVRDLHGKYKPIYLAIDAMEPDVAYPTPNQNGGMAGASANDQIETLAKLLDIVQKGNPGNQNQTLFETIANLKVDLAKNDANNNTNMMQTAVKTLSDMATAQMNRPTPEQKSLISELAALIAVLAPTGLLEKAFKPSPTVNVQGQFIETLKTAKEMGLIPEKEDLVTQLAKFKQAGLIPDTKKDTDPVERTLELMGKMKQLMPGEKTGSDPLWFKLVDSFAPHALKLGSEALAFFREKAVSKRRFVESAPQSMIPQNPALVQRRIIPPAEVAPPSNIVRSNSGIFDDNDEALMRQQNEYIARRNAQIKSSEPAVPTNESSIPADHLAEISSSARDSFDPSSSAPINIPIKNTSPSLNRSQPQPQPQQFEQPNYQPQIDSQESLIMQVFQQMKAARDANDPAYFPILRELILQQAGDEMYDSIVIGDIPMMTIFSKVRFIAGAWIDETATANYFNQFLLWAREQQKNEVVVFCQKCDEEIVYASTQDWNTSDKHCQVCKSPLILLGPNNGEHLDANQLVNMETGEANIKLPGEA